MTHLILITFIFNHLIHSFIFSSYVWLFVDLSVRHMSCSHMVHHTMSDIKCRLKSFSVCLNQCSRPSLVLVCPCPIILPFVKLFLFILFILWRPLSVVLSMSFIYHVCLQSFSQFPWKYLRQEWQTHLTVSCPDGKPSEEPPKGRGRGFGGENTLTLELTCTNSRWSLCLKQFHLLHNCC